MWQTTFRTRNRARYALCSRLLTLLFLTYYVGWMRLHSRSRLAHGVPPTFRSPTVTEYGPDFSHGRLDNFISVFTLGAYQTDT